MKVVRKFETEDGQLFDDQPSARKHEIEIEAEDKIKAICLPAFNSGRAEAVVRSVVANAKAVRDALSSFLKKQPKEEKDHLHIEETLDDAL